LDGSSSRKAGGSLNRRLCASSDVRPRSLHAPFAALGIAVGGDARSSAATNLWVQSSFVQNQRLQRVFFPEGIRFDGKAC
jgi:hypothetical protein